MPTSDEIRQAIIDTATSYGIDPNIALAVAQHESGLNPEAIGSKGEIGIFQLMPATAASLGVDPTNWQENIRGGIAYLASLFGQFGSWDQALAAYNAGPGRVSRGQVPASTQSYVRSVLNLAQSFGSSLLAAVPAFYPAGSSDSGGVPFWVPALGLGMVIYILLPSRRRAA
jgi:soluble lytic murein transglycosylase-like protein